MKSLIIFFCVTIISVGAMANYADSTAGKKDTTHAVSKAPPALKNDSLEKALQAEKDKKALEEKRHRLPVFILLIVLAGLIAGTNNFMAITDSSGRTALAFFGNWLSGSIGAALVPLFLKISSSTLLCDDDPCCTIYLIVFGYMLIAAVFGKKLVEKLGKSVFGLDADAVKSLAQNVINNQQEPAKTQTPTPEMLSDIKNELPARYSTLSATKGISFLAGDIEPGPVEAANKVLANMQGSKYRWRTAEGISNSTQIDEDKVQLILNVFKTRNVVTDEVRNGTTYYTLTDLGQTLKLFK